MESWKKENTNFSLRIQYPDHSVVFRPVARFRFETEDDKDKKKGTPNENLHFFSNWFYSGAKGIEPVSIESVK